MRNALLSVYIALDSLRDLIQRDAHPMPIHYRLKPALRAAVEQSPSLWVLEGG